MTPLSRRTVSSARLGHQTGAPPDEERRQIKVAEPFCPASEETEYEEDVVESHDEGVVGVIRDESSIVLGDSGSAAVGAASSTRKRLEHFRLVAPIFCFVTGIDGFLYVAIRLWERFSKLC